ncbi:MAG TPA: RDD family protein [Alphaproteobacteria bacterium]
MAALASSAGFEYAPFGLRLAALALDAAVLALLLIGSVHAVNAVAGRRWLMPYWVSEEPVRREVEVASRNSERQKDGSVRERTVGRETRIYADGTLRIYVVADTTLTAADGAAQTTHAEVLIGRNAADIRRDWLTRALFALVPFVYFAAMEASRLQGTLGKLALGLRVTDREGRRLSLLRSVFRQLMKLLELFSSGITYLIAAFTPRHQALHDMLAGTFVVRAPSDAAGVRPCPC